MSKLATAVSFAMAEPGRLVGQTAPSTEPEDIDADGEYEMDDMQYEQEPAAVETPDADADGHTTDAEGSEVDAEGEEVVVFFV